MDTRDNEKNNIYSINPKTSNDEVFLDLLKKDNVHIEKILSYGQTTPIDKPYVQDHDEWVLVLEGKAKLKLQDENYTLNQGEYLFIPKGVQHWVTYTADPTIWLAVHFKK